jgi:hypothetical protein
MSVTLEDTLKELKRLPETAAVPGGLLVSLTAGFAREHDQEVARTPKDYEPAHGDVVGAKTNSVKDSFARNAAWVIGP